MQVKSVCAKTILLIDVGNTKIKWRYSSHENSSETHSMLHKKSWLNVVEAIVSTVPSNEAPSALFVASVLADENATLQALLENRFGVPVHHYVPQKEEFGFKGCYADQLKLGVDRWLAILEAWCVSGASIVIDCGSAITVDVASEDGRHLGGYIVPGIEMQIKALYAGTSQVKVERGDLSSLELGEDTVSAVRNGVLRMVVAFLAGTIVDVKNKVPSPTIYLIGGDAEMLSRYLPFEVVLGRPLVLDGLMRVAHKNT